MAKQKEPSEFRYLAWLVGTWFRAVFHSFWNPPPNSPRPSNLKVIVSSVLFLLIAGELIWLAMLSIELARR